LVVSSSLKRAILGRVLLSLAVCAGIGYGVGHSWAGAIIGGVIAVAWITAFALKWSGETEDSF
jgi:hypothetical protein